jgi:hypothetical protein
MIIATNNSTYTNGVLPLGTLKSGYSEGVIAFKPSAIVKNGGYLSCVISGFIQQETGEDRNIDLVINVPGQYTNRIRVASSFNKPAGYYTFRTVIDIPVRRNGNIEQSIIPVHTSIGDESSVLRTSGMIVFGDEDVCHISLGYYSAPTDPVPENALTVYTLIAEYKEC